MMEFRDNSTPGLGGLGACSYALDRLVPLVRLSVRSIIAIAAVLFVTAAFGQAPEEQAAVSERDDTSYALGMQLVANAQRLFGDLTLDNKAFIDGLRDVLNNNAPRYSTAVMSDVLRQLGEEKTPTGNDDARTSYTLGAYLSQQIAIHRDELDVESFLQGVGDPLGGRPPAIDDKTVEKLLRDFVERRQQERKQRLAENKKKNRRFFAARREADGVKELQEDMLYEVLQTGDGKQPTEKDQVVVHYTGTLIDGTEFDSSRSRGEPSVFSPLQVIRGWQIALTRMRVGDRWKIYIPPDLAYGDGGSPPAIPPGAALIFDVELLEVRSDGT